MTIGPRKILLAALGALGAIVRGGATVAPEIVGFLRERHDPPPVERRRERRLYRHFRSMARHAARTYFVKRDIAGPWWRAYQLPHSQPQVRAIVRNPDGSRRHVQVHAFSPPPAGACVVEHLNGFGQVARRERLTQAAAA